MSQHLPEEPARDDATVDPAAATDVPEPAASAPEPAASAPEPAASAQEPPPAQNENTGPSTNRIILWVIVGGVALYLIGSGVYGILVT